MAKEHIIIADNQHELCEIIRQFPLIKFSKIILLSRNFSLQGEDIKNIKFHYFDELISKDDGLEMYQKINKILWNWFLDSKRKDLSLIDNLSLGAAFVSSIDIILNTQIRYLYGIKKFIKNNISQKFYLSSTTEYIFKKTMHYLEKENSLKIVIVDGITASPITKFGKNKINFDAGLRYRDLSKFFLKQSFKSRVAKLLLYIFQKKNIKKNGYYSFLQVKRKDFLKHSETKRQTKILIGCYLYLI